MAKKPTHGMWTNTNKGDLDGTADEASEGAARALEGEFRPPRRGKSQKGDGP